MYTPQIEPRSTLTLPEPQVYRSILYFFRCIMQPYARALHFSEPVMLSPERMTETWRDFNEGKSRLIIGFRHAYGDDPQLMAYTIHHVLPKAARKLKKPLKGLTHAHFIYGVEVPLWSGPFVKWLLPRAGAVPVDHIHMDTKGMNRIRTIICDGDFPLALAPEGHVTYNSNHVPHLETGTARFGFWCVEDLEKKNRTEDVIFLPISTHYQYKDSTRKKLSHFIADMEKICNLEPLPKLREIPDIRKRLEKTGKAIQKHIVAYYTELNARDFPDRAENLVDQALYAAERILAITPLSDEKAISRLYKIRSKAWGRIFRSDLDSLTMLQKELASRKTGEAWFAMRHMETAELLLYVDLTQVSENADLDTCWEIASNYFDYIERLKGGTLRNRATIVQRKAYIIPGEPIRINDYLEEYKKDKKTAMQNVTNDMKKNFENCVDEYKLSAPKRVGSKRKKQ